MEVDNITGQIALGAALSNQIDIGTKVVVGLVIPAGWTAAAGGLSFQSSIDGGVTWNELVNPDGTAYTLLYVAAGAIQIAVDPNRLRGVSSLKIRSGTLGAPVNQAAAVVLTLITRLVF